MKAFLFGLFLWLNVNSDSDFEKSLVKVQYAQKAVFECKPHKGHSAKGHIVKQGYSAKGAKVCIEMPNDPYVDVLMDRLHMPLLPPLPPIPINPRPVTNVNP
jgi:hypothetical protein